MDLFSGRSSPSESSFQRLQLRLSTTAKSALEWRVESVIADGAPSSGDSFKGAWLGSLLVRDGRVVQSFAAKPYPKGKRQPTNIDIYQVTWSL